MRYRPKGEDVEALQYTGENVIEVVKFIGNVESYTVKLKNENQPLKVSCVLEGLLREQASTINMTDYVVRQTYDHSVMGAEQFEKFYQLREEPVEEPVVIGPPVEPEEVI